MPRRPLFYRVVRRWLGAAGLILATGCTFSPPLPEGKLKCGKDSFCPEGLSFCRADGLCYSTPAVVEGTGGRGGTGSSTGIPGGGGAGGAGGATTSTPQGGGGAGGRGGSSGSDGMAPPDLGSNGDGGVPKPDVAVDRPSGTDTPMSADAAHPPDAQPPMEASAPVDWPECVAPAVPGLPVGLLAHLRLDETGTNPVLSDSSPNKLDVMASGLEGGGATWISGRFQRGLSLSGGANGGFVKVGTTHMLNAAYEGFTLSTWAKFAPGTPGNGVIASRRAEGPYGYLYRISVAAGRLRVQIHTANGFNADLSGQLLPTNGRWMHIAVTYATIPGTVAAFVNGVAFGSAKFSLQLGPENTPLVLGGAESIVRPPPGTIPPPITIIDRLPGALDEISFFKRALTQSEVMALACGALPVP